MKEAADIKLQMGEYGVKEFVLNGTDITEMIKGLQITSNSDSPPVYSLVLYPGSFELEGKGIVKVPVKSEDDKERFIKLLSQISAASVEEMALKNLGWGDNTTQAILDYIISVVERAL